MKKTLGNENRFPTLSGERKFCPRCKLETEVERIVKPDVDLKLCKICGSAVSILYKDS